MLERDAPYVQIIGHYRQEIRAGRLEDGGMLHAGCEIAKQFGVSMATAAKVAALCKSSGWSTSISALERWLSPGASPPTAPTAARSSSRWPHAARSGEAAKAAFWTPASCKRPECGHPTRAETSPQAYTSQASNHQGLSDRCPVRFISSVSLARPPPACSARHA